MKKLVLLFLLSVLILKTTYGQQSVFYLAKYLREQYSTITKTIPLDASVKAALNKEVYKNITLTKEILNGNPFFNKLFDDPGGVSVTSFITKGVSNIGGLDVTKYAKAIADLMIERAKQELTIAFFDRFKQFAEDNKEVQILLC